jgi:flagellin
MASIMTNVSAMTALQSLNATNKALDTLRPGFPPATASQCGGQCCLLVDCNHHALRQWRFLTVKDALGLGAATIDVAYTGMNKAIEVAKEIKNKLVAARQPGIDREKVQSEIAELQNQLTSISESSVFSGENWLSVDSSDAAYNSTKTIVASFSRAGGSSRSERSRSTSRRLNCSIPTTRAEFSMARTPRPMAG